MGFTSIYPSADKEYIEKNIVKDKELGQAANGFRICGMQTWESGSPIKSTKEECRQLVEVDDIGRAFQRFFVASNPGDGIQTLRGVLSRLHEIRRWFVDSVPRINSAGHCFFLASFPLIILLSHVGFCRLVCCEARFLQQKRFHFFSSSLLILYESSEVHCQQAQVGVHMIDFAHVQFQVSHLDQNCIDALSSIISHGERLVHNLVTT